MCILLNNISDYHLIYDKSNSRTQDLLRIFMKTPYKPDVRQIFYGEVPVVEIFQAACVCRKAEYQLVRAQRLILVPELLVETVDAVFSIAEKRVPDTQNVRVSDEYVPSAGQLRPATARPPFRARGTLSLSLGYRERERRKLLRGSHRKAF